MEGLVFNYSKVLVTGFGYLGEFQRLNSDETQYIHSQSPCMHRVETVFNVILVRSRFSSPKAASTQSSVQTELLHVSI